jgi:tRNA (adenine57-N1/adenine58-N1)-methyltransferase
MFNLGPATVALGDTVMFVGKDRKTFIRTLRPGGSLQTHFGVVRYDDIVGLPFGSRLQTHLGHPIWMLAPNLDDVIRHLERESQIIFPKDLGYILLKLGVRPGVDVIEAGTGSGALTLTLAVMVGDDGHVYSYDRRAEMQQLARRNLERFGLAARVTLTERDIIEGFDQREAHALFLDVLRPWDYLEQAWRALRSGGFLGCIVPTINQVVVLDEALHRGPWFLVEVEEILLRQYKTVPERIRPADQMVGHTGYLVFARALADGALGEPSVSDEMPLEVDAPDAEEG